MRSQQETHGDNAVEHDSVVISSLREFRKVFARLKLLFVIKALCGGKRHIYPRSMVPVELELDIPEAGLKYDRFHGAFEEIVTRSVDPKWKPPFPMLPHKFQPSLKKFETGYGA